MAIGTELVRDAVKSFGSNRLSESKKGCFGTFLVSNISPQWGYKIYGTRIERDRCWFWQRELNNHGLSVKVGQKFSCVISRNQQRYGYVTEVADVIFNTHGYGKLWPSIRYFLRKLERTNMQFRDEDGHYKNLAFYKGGIVTIDTDNTYAIDQTPEGELHQKYLAFMRKQGHARA